MESLPRVNITSPAKWDPRVLDTEVDDEWFTSNPPNNEYFKDNVFDAQGKIQDDLYNLDDEPDGEDYYDPGKVISVRRVEIEAKLTESICVLRNLSVTNLWRNTNA